MPRLKKIVVVMMTLMSTVVAAGTMGQGGCIADGVTVPCAGSAWEFGAQALYLNRNYSLGNFTQTTVNTLVPNASLTPPSTYNIVRSEDWFHTANNKWNWGFKLEAAYHYHTGNDVNLNWYHYTATSNQILVQGSFANTIYDSPTNDSFYSDVANQIATKWDAVNLELAQHIDISEPIKMRVHGGFQYAHFLTTDNNTAISASTAALVASTVWNGGSNYDMLNTYSTLKYNGFGPRIGADLFYGWRNGITLYANGASALLIGSRSFNISDLSVVNASGAPNNGPLGSQNVVGAKASDNAIVPELEVKAGGTYSYTMTKGILSIDAGWMWNNYFNVLSSNGTDFEDVMDFGVQGPYIGLKWVG